LVTVATYVDELVQNIGKRGDEPAINWRGQDQSCSDLLASADAWMTQFDELGISAGTVCGIAGDYSPQVCGLFLALMQTNAVLVPLTSSSASQLQAPLELAGATKLFRFDNNDQWTIEDVNPTPANDLMTGFLERQHPGLVVVTSGSTGQPKGILHDCEMVLRKFSQQRQGYRTLLFLLMDHFGGFNTLMSVLSYGGTAVIAAKRTPEEVCRTVQDARVELLPVTPTFINLLLASRCYEDFDLSSVRLITYGTEVMPESTLARIATAFPEARLQQTYGLSELGVLRSRSKDSGSVWVKVGGEGFETKIIDGMLWVRSQSAMVGYLNAPSPFDDDNWMNTGDLVEVDGDYVRILGRDSDIINVGGQKVFPVEVESVLIDAENVTEAAVYALKSPLLGEVVAARVSLRGTEDPVALKARLRKFCLERLASSKVPVRFVVVPQEELQSDRAKKVRAADQG
jgi:acyl-CoA synthetase (AMP-forming)/AMP-acid ligase II